jgi:hypothetical protein
VLDDPQFDDWMRGTSDQAAEMMKPYTGEIEAWEVGARSLAQGPSGAAPD